MLGLPIAVVIYTVFVGLLMKLANYIGESIGIAKILQKLWWKIVKSKE